MDRHFRLKTAKSAIEAARRLADSGSGLSEEEVFRGLEWNASLRKSDFLGMMVSSGLLTVEDGLYSAIIPELLRSVRLSDDGRTAMIPRPRTLAKPLVGAELSLKDRIRAIMERMSEEKGWKVLVGGEIFRRLYADGVVVLKEEIELTMLELAEEMEAEPIAVMIHDGTFQVNLKKAGLTLEEALTSDFGAHSWEVFPGLVPGVVRDREVRGYRVLSDQERLHKKVTSERAAEEEIREEREVIVQGLAEKLRAYRRERTETTTRDVVLDVMGVEPDPNGKLNALAASAMKLIGMRSERRKVGGKARTVFVLPAAAEEPEDGLSASGESVEELVARVIDGQFPDDPDPGTEEPPVETVPDMRPEAAPLDPGAHEDPDEAGLPEDWRSRVLSYVDPEVRDWSSGFVTLDEMLVRALSSMPYEIGFRQKGLVSRYMSRLGFSADTHGRSGRRFFFRRGARKPSLEEVGSSLSELDRQVEESLGIKPSDAPEWMGEGEARDLSHLEHAVLLLCDGVHRPRAAIFPGHRDPEWQRRVLSRLQEEGVVEPRGDGNARTYAGVGRIEEMLRAGVLAGMFWERPGEAADPVTLAVSDLDISVRADSVLAAAGIGLVAGLTEMTEKDLLYRTKCGMKVVKEIRLALHAIGLSFLPEAEAEPVESEEEHGGPADDLEDLVAEMWEVVQVQAQQIASLKERVKALEEKK